MNVNCANGMKQRLASCLQRLLLGLLMLFSAPASLSGQDNSGNQGSSSTAPAQVAPTAPAAGFPPPTSAPTTTPAPASSTPPATPETGVLATVPTAESLQQQIAALEKDETLEAGSKDQAIQAYRLALEGLQKTASYGQRTQENLKLIQEIPQKAITLQQQIDSLPEQFPLGVDNNSSLAELEQALTLATTEMRNFEAERLRAEQESTQRSNQRKQLVELLATHPNRLKELQEKMSAPADASVAPLVAKAISEQQKVQLQLITREGEAIKEELNRFDIEKNNRYQAVDLELWTRRAALQQKKIQALQQLQTNRKRMQTQDQLKDLKKQENEHTYHSLQSHLDEIAVYTKRVGELVELTQTAQDDANQVQAILSKVATNERDTNDKEKELGLAWDSETFTLSLLRQLYELPDIGPYRDRIRHHRSRMSEATFQQIELRSEARKLINLDQAIDEAIVQVKQELETEDLGFFEEGLRNNLRRLLTQKRDAIENLESAYNRYADTITQLVTDETSLVNTVERYRDFIQTRIFWLRSDKTLSLTDLTQVFQLQTLDKRWQEMKKIGPAILTDLSHNQLINLLGLVVWLFLVLLRLQAGGELNRLSDQARKTHNSQIMPTLRAILLTALITAPGPLLVWFLGWRIESIPDKSSAQLALASTLKSTGMIYGCLEFFRQLCRPNGVVDAHFNGPESLTTQFRRDYVLALALLLPLFFLVGLLGSLTPNQSRLPGERVLFCLGLLISAYFAQRTLRPNSPLMREVFLMKQSTLITQTRWFWHPVVTLFPLVLALMAWLGYYYTATQLSWRLLNTLILLGFILFGWGLALRWYRMAQRWFRIYVLRQRMRQPVDEAQTMEGQRLKLEQDSERRDEDREKQTLKLINYGTLVPLFVGLWVIWSDVLPAVAFLDEFPVWHTYVQREVEGTDGLPTVRTVREAITPINLMMAAFVTFITIFLSRNMPGMVDFALLQRLGIDPSLRYALTSVTGYLLTFIGFSYGFSLLGFRWEQIQWLAAALTFGLSFGLQEIFANFISGLIILFERPVRIGDIVTIEGVTGVVTRIRIRASTITDWDRKEFLVPNKELVTGRVLNWTLSDTMNRVVIPVGVSYNADVDKAREILFEIANSDPELLKEPGPVVVIEAFGNNAMNFALRGFLASLEKRAETIHRLHANINKRFKEENIEIAFPQQNLNIRSFPPQWRESLQELAEAELQSRSSKPAEHSSTKAD